MKHIFSFLVCIVLAFSVVSCGSDKENGTALNAEQPEVTKNTNKDVSDSADTQNEVNKTPTVKAKETKPIPSDAAENACGDNITWRYDKSSETLFIEGDGDMWDFVEWNEDNGEYDDVTSPWYWESFSSCVISEGITSIGDYAFSGCELENITIPNSVTYIGKWAFNYCDMTSIVIPESVTFIADNAFAKTKLVSITIPESVLKAGKWIFYNCYDLKNVHFEGTAQQWEKLGNPVVNEAVLTFGK